MRWNIWLRKLALNMGIAVAIALLPAAQALTQGDSVNWKLVLTMGVGSAMMVLVKQVINLKKHLGTKAP